MPEWLPGGAGRDLNEIHSPPVHLHRRLRMGSDPRNPIRARVRPASPAPGIGLRLQLGLRAFDSFRALAGGTPQLVLLRLRSGELALQILAVPAMAADRDHQPAQVSALAVEMATAAPELSRLLRPIQPAIQIHLAV